MSQFPSTRTSSSADIDEARSRQAAVAEEQRFLDRALTRQREVLAQLESEIGEATEDSAGQARVRGLRARYQELRRAGDGLVFGRLDAIDGTVRHVGRIGLRHQDENADPLVLDWRADAARPFYTATPLEPQGQARRRHVRAAGQTVVGVDDEPLDGADDRELVGEGALLAALGQRRTGQMSTAIATLQREQDDIIRASASGPLIVQGGPGTGKTVVALHRVAYLLFTQQQLADQAVLVLGPSPRFLDYIAQVLPALGETAVVSATCDGLIPGVTVTRREERRTSEIKGRALWQPAIESYLTSLRPPAEELRPRWEGEEYPISAAVIGQALRAVSGRPYHDARRTFGEQFQQILTDAIVERREAMLREVEEGFEDILARVDKQIGTDAPAAEVMSEDEVEELRERLAGSAELAAFIAAWWPDQQAGPVLRRLLSDPALLRQHAPVLESNEIEWVAGEPEGWAPSDIPLLDAVADHLGEPVPRRTDGEFVADRARRERGWIYGHVAIDEAQELSEMQWQMVLRRCPTRSITAVGDIDQAEASHRHTSWAQAVRAAFGDRWTAAELTICYRTPREVMELTGPVLERAGSHNAPPRAVRSSGIEPWETSTTPGEITQTVSSYVRELQERWAGGTTGVVTTARLATQLADFLPGVPVLTATEAKGLEWDATLVVDPDGISAEPRGWNGLYVALTRCTQELGQIRLRA